MTAFTDEGYLSDLSRAERDILVRVNRDGAQHLVELLSGDRAVAFLGAGTSAPLYPLWGELIGILIDRCADQLSPEVAASCHSMWGDNPDGVVELLRTYVGPASYREMLRDEFRARRDEATGLSFTRTQELVARCNFAGVLTTNYDPGIVNARMAVRRDALATGFASWRDEDILDRWNSGAVFRDDEMPVLYVHGQHNRPADIVLATSEYREAYRGKLRRVLRTILDTAHVVWIGFGFGDRRIVGVLDAIGDESGTALVPAAARHVALIPWDPADETRDPATMRRLTELKLGAKTIVYPVRGHDHSALQRLLEPLADPRFPPAGAARRTMSARRPAIAPDTPEIIETWTHGGEPLELFTGRAEELSRLRRWAEDPEVRLIGITAWGGAGKSTLVTDWLRTRRGASARDGVRGVFAWSFYVDRSGETWAEQMLLWAEREFGVRVSGRSLEHRVLKAMRAVPVILVLDGLEVIQESAADAQFGRLLDPTLRSVLVAGCQIEHGGFLVLTSRSPFPDLEPFDGGVARMLDVPSFTPEEGASLLKRAGGEWLPHRDRVALVRAVDGHALAVAALAGAIVDRPATADLRALRDELEHAGRTDSRVARVLAYYAERLSPSDRALVATVSLFQRPVPPAAVLAVIGDAGPGSFGVLTDTDVEAAVRRRLTGLLTWHSNRTISAHPLVAESFRALALTAETAQLASTIALADVPAGQVSSHDDAARIVEAVELLLEAGLWEPASELYSARTANGYTWLRLPAASLGQRCASAFVADEARMRACREHLSDARLDFFLNEAGLFAMLAGNALSGARLLRARAELASDKPRVAASALRNLSATFGVLGDVDASRTTAAEALELARRDGGLRANSYAALATASDLAGDTPEAERQFLAADALSRTDADDPGHLSSAPGAAWARFLLRTDRQAAARTLTEANRERSEFHGRRQDVARCDAVLALCDLHDGRLERAEQRLDAATAVFHAGDYLVEWIAALLALVDLQRARGELDQALRTCTSVIEFTSMRSLVPLHAFGLSKRGRVRVDLFARTQDAQQLERARDDGEHAQRLVTRTRHVPWAELDALRTLAACGKAWAAVAGGPDRSRYPLWESDAAAVEARLVPDGLNREPLGASR